MWMTHRRYVDAAATQMWWDAAIVIIPAGIIGGRLYHVITDHEKYFCADCNPVDALKVTNGGPRHLGRGGAWRVCYLGHVQGRGAHGAVCRRRRPRLILAQAIGRLGNWFNQELYGRPTDVPWALDIFYRVNEAGSTHQSPGTPRARL